MYEENEIFPRRKHNDALKGNDSRVLGALSAKSLSLCPSENCARRRASRRVAIRRDMKSYLTEVYILKSQGSVNASLHFSMSFYGLRLTLPQKSRDAPT